MHRNIDVVEMNDLHASLVKAILINGKFHAYSISSLF